MLSHEAELGRSQMQTISKILFANLLRSSCTPLDDGFDGATADGQLEAPGPINEKYAAYLDGPDAHRAVVTGANLVPPRQLFAHFSYESAQPEIHDFCTL